MLFCETSSTPKSTQGSKTFSQKLPFIFPAGAAAFDLDAWLRTINVPPEPS